MKLRLITGILAIASTMALGAAAGDYKFLANCNVDGKEFKGVHVHDISYPTMEACETGRKFIADTKSKKIIRGCNDHAKAKAAKTKFSLYCVKG